MYIYQNKTWPNFTWGEQVLSKMLTNVRHKQGRLPGKMEGLGFSLKEQVTLQTLTQDVLKSSESKEKS